MLIYNVTINIEETKNEEWLRWMKENHIPEVMKTGCFTHYYLSRILTTQPDETGFTYSIQYHCNHSSDYENYIQNHAESLQKEHTEKFEGNFVAFRTIMEKL